MLLLSLQSCPTLCYPKTAAHWAPLSLGFSRQEYWSELPFPSPPVYSTYRQIVRFHLYRVPRIVKFIESENIWVDTRSWEVEVGGKGNGELVFNGKSFSLGKLKNSGDG